MTSIQFGNITIEGNFPEQVPAGSYLQPFIKQNTSESTFRIHVAMDQAEIAGADGDIDTGDYFYNEQTDRIVSRFAHQMRAAAYCPGDWRRGEFACTLNPKAIGEPSFTLNQLLSLIGIHGAFIYRGAMIFHASYIISEGEAILFLGPSGTGKSTQASLWKMYAGAEVVNGDRALLFYENGRLHAGGISVCGSSDICKNVSVPVKAIVILKQEPQNTVRSLRPAQAYAKLLAASQFHHWRAEENHLAGDFAAKLIADTNIFQFGCVPDESAVEALHKYLR